MKSFLRSLWVLFLRVVDYALGVPPAGYRLAARICPCARCRAYRCHLASPFSVN